MDLRNKSKTLKSKNPRKKQKKKTKTNKKKQKKKTSEFTQAASASYYLLIIRDLADLDRRILKVAVPFIIVTYVPSLCIME